MSTCGGVPQALTSLGMWVIAKRHIEFSRWFPWKDRNDIPDVSLPGVYALAHFRRPPQGVADPLDYRVRYIGQSCCRGGVKGRLNLFDRSARTGRKGHSGGKTFHGDFGGIVDGLYVAAYTVSDPRPLGVRNAFILFVERELIWKFSVAHGKLPKCNKC